MRTGRGRQPSVCPLFSMVILFVRSGEKRTFVPKTRRTQ